MPPHISLHTRVSLGMFSTGAQARRAEPALRTAMPPAAAAAAAAAEASLAAYVYCGPGAGSRSVLSAVEALREALDPSLVRVRRAQLFGSCLTRRSTSNPP